MSRLFFASFLVVSVSFQINFACANPTRDQIRAYIEASLNDETLTSNGTAYPCSQMAAQKKFHGTVYYTFEDPLFLMNKLTSQGTHISVLNPANKKNIGGGVRTNNSALLEQMMCAVTAGLLSSLEQHGNEEHYTVDLVTQPRIIDTPGLFLRIKPEVFKKWNKQGFASNYLIEKHAAREDVFSHSEKGKGSVSVLSAAAHDRKNKVNFDYIAAQTHLSKVYSQSFALAAQHQTNNFLIPLLGTGSYALLERGGQTDPQCIEGAYRGFAKALENGCDYQGNLILCLNGDIGKDIVKGLGEEFSQDIKLKEYVLPAEASSSKANAHYDSSSEDDDRDDSSSKGNARDDSSRSTLAYYTPYSDHQYSQHQRYPAQQ